MSSWLSRLRGHTDNTYRDITSSPTPPTSSRPRKQGSRSSEPKPDPNAPARRLQLHQKCLYERTLPGGAFTSAHVNRLQHGYYQSKAVHEPTLDNVYLVSVHFVFHPYFPRSHRFKSAAIKVSIHGYDPAAESHWRNPLVPMPRILKHAPELMYGSVSPENLQWNFSLSSSLGVSQAPVAATLNPSAEVRTSYKVFHMMSIQGSVRSIESPLGPDYDIEDAMAVWTLEENVLQRSGLPRDFDFVLLVHKPNDIEKVYLTVDLDAEIDCWYGVYPKWYTNRDKYMPTQDFTFNFDSDIGQRFTPSHPTRGFNFADLPQPLEQYVQMPGTTYPTNDTLRDWRGDRNSGDIGLGRRMHHFGTLDDPVTGLPKQAFQPPQTQTSLGRGHNHENQMDQLFDLPQRLNTLPEEPNFTQASKRHSWAPDSQPLNLRLFLERTPPPPARASTSAGYSNISMNLVTENRTGRRQSIRRRRSQSQLKEYSAQQALADSARALLSSANGVADTRRSVGRRTWI